MRRIRWFFPLCGLVLLVVFGCKVAPPQPPLVETVAILPFDSESNDVDAPDIMQRLVYLALQPSDYRLIDKGVVEKVMQKVGIVDGGQLAAADPVKLGQDLGTQALMYGNVESFGYTNIGVYVSRKVTLELKLVDATTGETLWENTGTFARRKFALDEGSIKENFAKGLADQLVDKIFSSPLAEEARLATRKTLSKLPGYKFRGFAEDKQTPSAGKKATKGVIKQVIENQ